MAYFLSFTGIVFPCPKKQEANMFFFQKGLLLMYWSAYDRGPFVMAYFSLLYWFRRCISLSCDKNRANRLERKRYFVL